MIHLEPVISKIHELLDQDTDSSITYAALESRLAIEKICYDRLRQSHDYIAHDQLKKWQPGAVINQLLEEVDPYVATTCTISISKNPVGDEGVCEDQEFVEIGTQIGFNHKKLTEIWNALSALALHVSLPKDKGDQIPAYGIKTKIKAKVEECLREIEKISQGTMTFSGFEEQVSFECSCGQMIKKRQFSLSDGSIVHCVDSECRMVWKAVKSEDGFGFECQTMDFQCSGCEKEHHISPKDVSKLRRDQIAKHECDVCQTKHLIQWAVSIRPAA